MISTGTEYVRQRAATRSACTYARALQRAHLPRCYRVECEDAAYRLRRLDAEAADGVADQLGPDDQAQNGHNDRVVLAHPVAQAGQDPLRPMAVPIWSPGLVSHHAAEAEMTG